MPLFDTHDGLTVAQEGRNARATSGHLNYLFVDSDRDTVIAIYTKFVAQARDFFGRRWRSVRGPNIDDAEFSDLTQKATLHWMYFYIVNRLPVWITEADWKHPQTHRIVQEVVERRFPTGSEEATMLCAHLTGLSRDGFLKWKEGDELSSNR
jgi:hypothetical protein